MEADIYFGLDNHAPINENCDKRKNEVEWLDNDICDA